jgi:hypothetical protein
MIQLHEAKEGFSRTFVQLWISRNLINKYLAKHFRVTIELVPIDKVSPTETHDLQASCAHDVVILAVVSRCSRWLSMCTAA